MITKYDGTICLYSIQLYPASGLGKIINHAFWWEKLGLDNRGQIKLINIMQILEQNGFRRSIKLPRL
jgi:hypothetical protein